MQEEERRTASALAALADDVSRLLGPTSGVGDTTWTTLPAHPAADAELRASAGANSAAGAPAWINQLVAPMVPQLPLTPSSAGAQNWWSSIASPVWGAVLGLLGGGSQAASTEADLPEFVLPEPRTYNLGFAPDGPEFFPVDRNGEGQIRRGGAGSSASEPKVTIEVQAMDSQSFLDRRREIADAVRLALLESHQLLDTLSSNE